MGTAEPSPPSDSRRSTKLASTSLKRKAPSGALAPAVEDGTTGFADSNLPELKKQSRAKRPKTAGDDSEGITKATGKDKAKSGGKNKAQAHAASKELLAGELEDATISKPKGKGKAHAKGLDEGSGSGKGKGKGKAPEEKRPKRFRKACPVAVQERLDRAVMQKMFVLDRKKDRDESPTEEVFTIAGTTGNVYHVTITSIPHCDCPDGSKNGTCKHILYIMTKVLKARGPLWYQAGLLKSELDDIFANAPAATTSAKRERKPLDEDDCPICYSELESLEGSVYCAARCGTNLHKACFEQWAATFEKSGKPLTCVMCREPWAGSADTDVILKKLAEKGPTHSGGYSNVASELGISNQRDYSTYSHWFHRRGGGGRYYY